MPVSGKKESRKSRKNAGIREYSVFRCTVLEVMVRWTNVSQTGKALSDMI